MYLHLILKLFRYAYAIQDLFRIEWRREPWLVPTADRLLWQVIFENNEVLWSILTQTSIWIYNEAFVHSNFLPFRN